MDNRRLVLAVTSLSNFLTPFMGSAVGIALPSISGEFAASAQGQMWVMMSFQLATAVLLLPMGRIGDLYGRARLFRMGLAAFTAASLLLAAPPSWSLLLALRAAQGAACAMIFCTGTPLLLTAYPASEHGRALGYNVAAVYLGLSLGPMLGGFLTETFGWRSVFAFSALLGAAAGALAWMKLPADPPAGGGRFDAAGASLYAVAALAVSASLPLLPHPGGRAAGIVLLASGLAGLAAFAVVESRTDQPILDLGMFRRNPAFTFSNLAALINYSASAAVGVMLSLYLQHIHGMRADRAGLVLLTQPALMAAFSPLAGRLSDRLQPRVVASLGMGLMAVGLAAFSDIGASTSLSRVLSALALLGLGFAFFSSPNTNAVMGSVAPSQYGVAAAILSTMRLAGHALSMGLVMFFFALRMGSAPLEKPVYPQFLCSLRLAFPALAGLGVLGIFASLARGDIRREDGRPR